jgi:hypothetical protein
VGVIYAEGLPSVRNTYLVCEEGEWGHRFGQEEYDLLIPDITYREFVAAQQ